MRLASPALVLVAAAAAAGCSSSSSGPAAPRIQAARTYELGGFRPAGPLRPGPTTLSFTIRQPSGKPLTSFRTGPGPHTGVHVIVVPTDLTTIIHRHPMPGPDGRVSERIDLPAPGRYRVVVDAYPKRSGPLPNYQLFRWLTVAGAARPRPPEPVRTSEVVGGFRFSIRRPPVLHAIQAASLQVTVTGPNGRPAHFTPWFGALAHAIFFRVGSLDYFHTHVCAPGATGCASVLGGTRVSGRSLAPGRLDVGVLLPVAGTWRMFLQCRVGGHVLTAPFTLVVR